MVLLSSEEWQYEIKDYVIILDPDGWNRRNFFESWNELITKEEFIKRLTMSTCKFKDFDKLNLWTSIEYKGEGYVKQ